MVLVILKGTDIIIDITVDIETSIDHFLYIYLFYTLAAIKTLEVLH